MRKVTFCLAVLGVLALAFIFMPMRAQNQGYPFPGFPPELSPLRTFRTPPAQGPLVPPTKFLKVRNAVPNKYIVVLNDDVVSGNAPLSVRRAQVSAIADSLAQAHGGKRGFVYETALKGFSIELPNEAAAIALSQNPQVKWVEEEGTVQASDQLNPPWGLDRIDQIARLPACGPAPTPTPPRDCGIDGDPSSPTSGLSLYPGATYTFTKFGTGVTAYVIDRGVRTSHQDFGTRTLTSIDCTGSIAGSPNECVNDTLTTGSDHGTHIAGIVGGTTYGVAKAVNIRSLRTSGPTSTVVAAVNWVTLDHNENNPSVPAMVNVSLLCSNLTTPPPASCGDTLDTAVQNSIDAGLTYAIAAGNDNSDVVTDGATPARVVAALTIGASTLSSGGTFIYSDLRASFSNFGNRVDLFAPGDLIRSASNTSDTASNPGSGTSEAAPHVAGAVALYLEGRTAASGCDCFSLYNSKVPNNMLPASSYAKLSTCPDRIAQFMKSNATLSDLDASTIGAGSPNRLLNTSSLSAPTNPIDNQRFFVWQHYADFLAKSTPSPAPTPDSCDPNNPYTGLISQEPDENGLNYWTSNITGCGVIGGCPQYNPAPTGCGTGFNDNNSCTAGKRIDVSRAFWVAVYPSWFNTSYGLTNFDPTPYATPNEKWLDECYWVYLRRRPPHDDLGFQYWLGLLNSSQYGNPANQDGVNFIIEAFIESLEYRQRSGQP